ncbi:MAG: hypothetical protein EZS28_009153 [Streblomastix strix]|uniref:Uncharacterized protein n=1 Tax=Streblomastix strix TaxID=222440 RepID=A0A5J4WK57_9EUKA|nr:MAG: hypothetical protein EZS28_009153 [Streblomastix strix]
MLVSTLRLAETHKTSQQFNKSKSCYIKKGAEKDTGHKVTIRFHTPDYKEICPVEMIKHNRVVDSIIRTFRNGFEQDLIGFATPSQLQQMAEIYNKIPHLAFMNRYTPKYVQYNRELERKFI